MKKPCDSSQIMYCSDKIINAASNRYRLVEQVANRAKRNRYEDLDNFEDTTIKPVVRAILEMCDEAGQTRVVGEHSRSTSYSSRSHSNKNPNSNSSSNTPSNGHTACIYYQNKYLELDKLQNTTQDYLKGITNDSAIENLIDREIKHSFSIDYSKLEKHLKNNKFKQADRETGLIVRSMCSWTGYDLNNYSIANLPRDEIKKIDRLWYEYSNGKFGFRVQKQIYEQVGKDIERFGTEVNWRGKPGWFDGAFSWHSYYQIIFNANSINGHLPAFWLEIAPGLPMRKGKIKNSLGVLLEREDINF